MSESRKTAAEPAASSKEGTRYDPAELEARWYARWESAGVFHADPSDPRSPFSIVIPPPNVTGVLHMGHALNNTFQDVLVRWRRMSGANACWIPGTDHAGIATQNVVERELRKEKTSRHDLGREKFLERVWAWKEKSGGTITKQLRALGASCDWQREQFTMSAELSRAVREVFVQLFEEKLIYRGKYLVNWCPRCRTALSNEEAEPQSVNGNLWWIKYPLEDATGSETHVTVATTRPETMLGDTAVAVNPNDPAKRALIGKTAILPFIGRKMPVIGDDHVKFGEGALGSGALKVTPAHDPNDYEIGRRHSLAMVNVLEEDGKINENGGDFRGLDRFEARKKIVAELDAKGLLERIEPHAHEVPHCQRCGTVVEPYLSAQWFVKMKPLADRALAAHDAGEVIWHPERWAAVYRRWLVEIRDWCISRQLWWGHRIPVFYCENCNAGKIAKNALGETRFAEDAKPIVSRHDVTSCPDCGGRVLQDEDVLDTWFSSWLWPFSTMGWPLETAMLATFYPTSVLVTAQDIIFFWVSRMIMAGYHFTAKRPFKDVYIHGIVRDERGEKMSKSKGNVIDPLEIIKKFSADALRYSMVMLTSEGQDCLISEKRIEEGRNFTTKLWNAARLVLGYADPSCATVGPADAKRLEDRWILSRLAATIARVEESLERFRLNDALATLYQFTWGELCDWYLELVKPRLMGDDAREKRIAAGLACYALDRVLRLLHPYVPFVTEELWSRLNEQLGRAPSLVALGPWPQPSEAPRDEAAEQTMEARIAAARAVREIRNKYSVPPKQTIEVLLTASDDAALEPYRGAEEFLKNRAIANAERVTLGRDLQKPANAAAATLGAVKLYVPGVFDAEAEKTRLRATLAKKQAGLEGAKKKLETPSFRDRAPPDVVARERERAQELEKEIAALEAEIKSLEPKP